MSGYRPKHTIEVYELVIRMGAGMKTALVMTDVTDAKMLEASPVRPDHVFDSIANLEGLLREFRQ